MIRVPYLATAVALATSPVVAQDHTLASFSIACTVDRPMPSEAMPVLIGMSKGDGQSSLQVEERLGDPRQQPAPQRTSVATLHIPEGKRPLALVISASLSTIVQFSGARERLAYVAITGQDETRGDLPNAVAGIAREKVVFLRPGCLKDVPDRLVGVRMGSSPVANEFKGIFGRPPERIQGMVPKVRWDVLVPEIDDVDPLVTTAGSGGRFLLASAFSGLEKSVEVTVDDPRFSVRDLALVIAKDAVLDEAKEPEILVNAKAMVDGAERVWRFRISVKDKDHFSRLIAAQTRPPATTPMEKLEEKAWRDSYKGRVAIDDRDVISMLPLAETTSSSGWLGLVELVKAGKIEVQPDEGRQGFRLVALAKFRMPPLDASVSDPFPFMYVARPEFEPLDVWPGVCVQDMKGNQISPPSCNRRYP